MAVIVNDMSEVNADADLVRKGDAALSKTEENLVEMSNGCILLYFVRICCKKSASLQGRTALITWS